MQEEELQWLGMQLGEDDDAIATTASVLNEGEDEMGDDEDQGLTTQPPVTSDELEPEDECKLEGGGKKEASAGAGEDDDPLVVALVVAKTASDARARWQCSGMSGTTGLQWPGLP